MQRCIQLAKNGLGTTYPNPMVGSVIVHDGKIIGEGWHYKAGNPHAEVNAIQSVKDPSLLKESAIYVSLEPCSHFGKTPPCADLIIQKGIRNVVIGTTDPNPKVAGSGIKKLEAAGCEVKSGVLEAECLQLNKRFFTFHTQQRPYIILKWAQSADGFIAPLEKDEKKPVWITNKHSRQLVHKMRSNEQAILVGTKTVIDDNPSLTTRTWSGKSPVRIVIDKELKIPRSASVFNLDAPTIVLHQSIGESKSHVQFEKINFSKNLPQEICSVLHEHKLQSVIIEGGSKTIQTFIDAFIWDEAWVFHGSMHMEEGIKAPILTSGIVLEEKNLQGDSLTIYQNPHS